MKRIFITALAAAAALSSCSRNGKAPEDYISSENLVVYQSTTAPESETATIPFTTTSANDIKGHLSYALNGTSVELSMDGKIVKTLDYYYIPDMTKIFIADFDFDGYDDIFIPYESPTSMGYYYCYYPEKNTFVQNDELSNIGDFFSIGENETLFLTEDDGYTNRTFEYKWSGNKLMKYRKIEVYKSTADNLVHTDIYKYDAKGNEVLEESR